MTIDVLEELFGEFGKVLSVRLRRVPKTKQFKGSAFIEFSTKEEAESVACKTVTYADKELILMTK